MSDIKKLELLADYQFLCYSVTAVMLMLASVEAINMKEGIN